MFNNQIPFHAIDAVVKSICFMDVTSATEDGDGYKVKGKLVRGKDGKRAIKLTVKEV
jgi:hypothetical protein